MSFAKWNKVLLQMRGATSDKPFGPDAHVFKVGEKMFAILAGTRPKGRISLKCDPHLGEVMRHQYESITPGYHLDKRHWITIEFDGSVPETEIRKLVGHSYDLVFRALPKKKQQELESVESPIGPNPTRRRRV